MSADFLGTSKAITLQLTPDKEGTMPDEIISTEPAVTADEPRYIFAYAITGISKDLVPQAPTSAERYMIYCRSLDGDYPVTKEVPLYLSFFLGTLAEFAQHQAANLDGLSLRLKEASHFPVFANKGTDCLNNMPSGLLTPAMRRKACKAIEEASCSQLQRQALLLQAIAAGKASFDGTDIRLVFPARNSQKSFTVAKSVDGRLVFDIGDAAYQALEKAMANTTTTGG